MNTSIIMAMGAALAVAAGGAADVQVPWWGQVLVAVAGSVSAFILHQLGKLVSKAFDFLAEKTRLTFFAQVDEVIMGFVSELAADKVAKLKAAAADGKLTPDEVAELKSIPMDKVKAIFGEKKLGAHIGEAVDEYLASRVERAVALHKAQTPNP